MAAPITQFKEGDRVVSRRIGRMPPFIGTVQSVHVTAKAVTYYHVLDDSAPLRESSGKLWHRDPEDLRAATEADEEWVKDGRGARF